jgi:hypothetical protein
MLGVMGPGVFDPNGCRAESRRAHVACRPIHTKRESGTDADEWQAAMQALLLVTEQDGPPMFARIGIMRR